jgi:hypothetical protein
VQHFGGIPWNPISSSLLGVKIFLATSYGNFGLSPGNIADNLPLQGAKAGESQKNRCKIPVTSEFMAKTR